jgi:hypothetical protein
MINYTYEKRKSSKLMYFKEVLLAVDHHESEFEENGMHAMLHERQYRGIE